MPCWGLYVQKLTCPVRVVCHVLLGFICTEAYLSCQGGLSCLVGVYMYRSLPVLSGWSAMSCWGLYVQKLTCPVRVVYNVLLRFICTEAYLSCQGGLSCLVGVYVYQKTYLSCQGGL